jgi:hypothetical protein
MQCVLVMVDAATREDPQTNSALEVQGGKVIWHGKDRDEVYRKAVELRPKHFATLYLGKMPENTAIVSNRTAIRRRARRAEGPPDTSLGQRPRNWINISREGLKARFIIEWPYIAAMIESRGYESGRRPFDSRSGNLSWAVGPGWYGTGHRPSANSRIGVQPCLHHSPAPSRCLLAIVMPLISAPMMPTRP